MALVSGPRQVGKTTTCRSIGEAYLNWDNADDRRRLLRGPAALAEALHLDRLTARIPVAVLDELHKYSKWKTLIAPDHLKFGPAKRTAPIAIK